MKSFRKHLDEKLKSERFKKLYGEERQLAALAVKIHGAGEQLGLSQQEVAHEG